jgi:hypothetical protein
MNKDRELESLIEQLRMPDLHIRQSAFELLKVKGLLYDGSLNGADLSFVDLTGADLKESKLIGVDLSAASVRWADLTGADLRGAELRSTNFAQAILHQAILRDTNLYQANLGAAELKNADLTRANLGEADLSYADLNTAMLEGAYLVRTKMIQTDVTQIKCNQTTFAGLDLTSVKGLSSVNHVGSSSIGIDTIYLSIGKIPEDFLRGCGVSEELMTFILSLRPDAC